MESKKYNSNITFILSIFFLQKHANGKNGQIGELVVRRVMVSKTGREQKQKVEMIAQKMLKPRHVTLVEERDRQALRQITIVLQQMVRQQIVLVVLTKK